MTEDIVARTKHGELTLDQLAEIQPGMSRLMVELADRFTVMVHAGRGGNWALSHFQFRQARGLFKIIATVRPKYAGALQAFEKAFMAPIEDAIKAKDAAALNAAAERAVQESDAQHAQLGYAYIRYRVPRTPPEHLDLTGPA
jgi:hypothetical protein